MLRNNLVRDRILDMIKRSAVALSHTEIRCALNGADRVTVYRSLRWLIERKLIYRIVNLDRSSKYAVYRQPAGQHTGKVHFSCVNCKKVVCLDGLQADLTLPDQYKLIDTNFVLFGLCPECACMD